MHTETYHIPVLLQEVIESFDPQPGDVLLDVTFGGGGHSQALLDTYPTLKIIGFDWDKEAIERGQLLVEKYEGRLQLIWGSFGHIYKLLKKNNIKQVNGILADFGTSQDQIKTGAGFSLYNDTPLDMRMSPSHFKVTAAQIVNYAQPEELREIFWRYGEERHAKKIVEALVEARKKKLFKTTLDLAEVIERVVKRSSSGNIHPATKVFQALRIFVNQEMDNITAFLPIAFEVLQPGGRFACISFHSLEDRPVKQFFQAQVKDGKGELLFKGTKIASDEELSRNRASRSAKLRVIKKI